MSNGVGTLAGMFCPILTELMTENGVGWKGGWWVLKKGGRGCWKRRVGGVGGGVESKKFKS